MKTLKKISLKSASVLDDKQMKQVYGGSGAAGEVSPCAEYGTCTAVVYAEGDTQGDLTFTGQYCKSEFSPTDAEKKFIEIYKPVYTIKSIKCD